MRLDKYLKVSRIIKRRTVANEACDAGKVEVNGIRCLQLMSTLLKRTLPKCTRFYKGRTTFLFVIFISSFA